MRTIPPAVAVFLVLAGHASTPAASVHRPIPAAETSRYRLVENWVHFPPEVTKWGQATGVDVDSHDNVYVFHRNELMMPRISCGRPSTFRVCPMSDRPPKDDCHNSDERIASGGARPPVRLVSSSLKNRPCAG